MSFTAMSYLSSSISGYLFPSQRESVSKEKTPSVTPLSNTADDSGAKQKEGTSLSETVFRQYVEKEVVILPIEEHQKSKSEEDAYKSKQVQPNRGVSLGARIALMALPFSSGLFSSSSSNESNIGMVQTGLGGLALATGNPFIGASFLLSDFLTPVNGESFASNPDHHLRNIVSVRMMTSLDELKSYCVSDYSQAETEIEGARNLLYDSLPSLELKNLYDGSVLNSNATNVYDELDIMYEFYIDHAVEIGFTGVGYTSPAEEAANSLATPSFVEPFPPCVSSSDRGTFLPTSSPTEVVNTENPSILPISNPSSTPTGLPNALPTNNLTGQPNGSPTGTPSSIPTESSTSTVTTMLPTSNPTAIDIKEYQSWVALNERAKKEFKIEFFPSNASVSDVLSLELDFGKMNVYINQLETVVDEIFSNYEAYKPYIDAEEGLLSNRFLEQLDGLVRNTTYASGQELVEFVDVHYSNFSLVKREVQKNQQRQNDMVRTVLMTLLKNDEELNDGLGVFFLGKDHSGDAATKIEFSTRFRTNRYGEILQKDESFDDEEITEVETTDVFSVEDAKTRETSSQIVFGMIMMLIGIGIGLSVSLFSGKSTKNEIDSEQNASSGSDKITVVIDDGNDQSI